MEMISHGRKSDEKCYMYVEELARFAVVKSGQNIMCCCLILDGKIMFRFRQSQH